MRDTTAEADFTRWARDRQGALLRTAVLLTGDRQRAEDLVQEALVVVASRWRSGHVERPEAYARQVIVRRNVSWWRKHRREVLRDPGAEHVHPADPVDRTGRAEDRMVLDAALARLTPKQRAVVVLRYFDDLSERDTAAALGVSPGTVKSQTHLALHRLRDHLPDLLDRSGPPGADAPAASRTSRGGAG